MHQMPQLDISTYPSQIFWFLVSFFILYMVVVKVIVPAIEKIQFKRNVLIESSIQNSAEFCKLSEFELEKQKALIDAAKAKANSIVESAKHEIEKMEDDARRALDKQLSEMYIDMEKRIESIKSASQNEVLKLTVDIVKLYYEKLTNNELHDMEKLQNMIKERLFMGNFE